MDEVRKPINSVASCFFFNKAKDLTVPIIFVAEYDLVHEDLDLSTSKDVRGRHKYVPVPYSRVDNSNLKPTVSRDIRLLLCS
jgi:hypothetical protein